MRVVSRPTSVRTEFEAPLRSFFPEKFREMAIILPRQARDNRITKVRNRRSASFLPSSLSFRTHFTGAFHGAEVPFVFNDQFELEGGERDLSERMATYWTTFARTGNPNGDTLSKVEQGGVTHADGAEEGEGRGEKAAGGGPPPPHHHWPPHRPTGPENCTVKQPTVVWPRYDRGHVPSIRFYCTRVKSAFLACSQR